MKSHLEEDKTQNMEKNLGKLEALFNRSIQKLLRLKDITKICKEDRVILSLFLAVQYIRSKEKREEIKDVTKQLNDKLSKEKLSGELELNLKEAQTKKFINSLHIDLLKESPQLADIIYNMKWIILINKTKTPFWTSDNPVAVHNEIDHYPYGNLGLKCIGFEMHFPLTPRLLLITCDPITFCNEPSQKILRDFRYVVREQSYQIYSSTRFVFSKYSDFQFAEKVLRESPIHGDPNRPRMKVD